MNAPYHRPMAGPSTRNETERESLDEDLSVHIFTVSATMVGVCLTAVSLIRVVITLRHLETLADDLVSLDAMLFVVSGLLSFWALRSRKRGRLHHIESIAEKVFLAAMILMGAACLALVYGIELI
jgi:hypothetical protein